MKGTNSLPCKHLDHRKISLKLIGVRKNLFSKVFVSPLSVKGRMKEFLKANGAGTLRDEAWDKRVGGRKIWKHRAMMDSEWIAPRQEWKEGEMGRGIPKNRPQNHQPMNLARIWNHQTLIVCSLSHLLQRLSFGSKLWEIDPWDWVVMRKRQRRWRRR